ncbi:hypothetical protein [Paenibacillus xylanexedens]|uniref:hypothetical protein n=1 Tax=Paenibacillus xylanexedens TaxID=528191 RepID=UPI000F53BE93|nr:hypothetical protein [Paenibacillus xylanexedens]RPK30156.1 hypothetical protein EDO6_00783 [Paenibacillus xylanexedens]
MAQGGEMSTTAEVMAHLASGNTRQQDAYYVLQSSGLQGDPYVDMLHLAEMKREDLWNWARSRTFF